MKRLLGIFVGTCILFSASSVQASNRLSHRFGVSLGILGDPFPTLLGYNASINLARWLRATGGYGQISGTTNAGEAKITTVGGGVRLFVPSWNFSPVVGLSYAKVSSREAEASAGLPATPITPTPPWGSTGRPRTDSTSDWGRICPPFRVWAPCPT